MDFGHKWEVGKWGSGEMGKWGVGCGEMGVGCRVWCDSLARN
ncbi:hypothetical protein [Microcystis aeruginosa]|nr:hypothetical protein [Microcystis aeruginosa]